MATPKVSDTTARTIRGTTQYGLPYAILALLQVFGVTHFTAEQLGAVLLAAGTVITYAQNALENAGKIIAIFKRVPPTPSDVPVADQAGYSLVGLLAYIAALALVVGGLIAILLEAVDKHPDLSTGGLLMVIFGVVIAAIVNALDRPGTGTRL